MVLSLNTMTNYHGGSTNSSLHSIQQLVLKLQHQVEGFIVQNKRREEHWKLKQKILQEQYSKIQQPENPDAENQDADNSNAEPSDSEHSEHIIQRYSEYSRSEIINSEEEIQFQNTSMEGIHRQQQKFSNDSDTTSNKFYKQNSVEIQSQIPDHELTISKTQAIQKKAEQATHLHHHSLVTLTGPATYSGASATNRGDLRSDRFEGGEEERQVPPPDSSDPCTTITDDRASQNDGDLLCYSSSSAEDDASATGKEEIDGNLSRNYSAEDGASATATEDASSDAETDTITGTDTSNNDATFDLCHRRVLPLVARPAALLAAAFPWNRDTAIHTDSVSGELEKKNHGRKEVTGAPLLTVEGEIAAAATMVVPPWVFAREMMQRSFRLHLEAVVGEWRLEEGVSFTPQTLMGLHRIWAQLVDQFKLHKRLNWDYLMREQFFGIRSPNKIIARPIKLWDPGGNFNFICHRIEIIV